MIYLDTHVIIWLYAGEKDLFPPLAQEVLEKNDLLISPIVALELQYLFETRKIKEEARTVIDDLYTRIGLSVCQQSFEKTILASLKQSWTRDTFDRIIVAQALLQNLPLLTKDKTIRKHYSKATWG